MDDVRSIHTSCRNSQTLKSRNKSSSLAPDDATYFATATTAHCELTIYELVDSRIERQHGYKPYSGGNTDKAGRA